MYTAGKGGLLGGISKFLERDKAGLPNFLTDEGTRTT